MRSRRHITFGLITVVLAGVLLLSGCVTLRTETRINADGSGTRSIIIAMDPSVMEMAQSQGEGDPFADAQAQAANIPGATVEEYVDPNTGNKGVKMTLPFQSLDELATMDFGEEDSKIDEITWSREGDIYTLTAKVNMGDLAAGASGEDAETMTEQEQQMATQMMAAMGLEFTYAVAVPGEIKDYSPQQNATYDAANNEIIWKLDVASMTVPEIMVKWDNSAAPKPIEAPAAAKPAAGVTTRLSEVQKYVEAVMAQDVETYTGLMAGGQMLTHPLMENHPELFDTPDFSVFYNTTFADAGMGAAQWTGTWTVDGATVELTGVDILTFDSEGKITTIESFVNPTEFQQLQALLE